MDDEEDAVFVFETGSQRQAFWDDIRAVLDKYPTVVNSVDKALEDERDVDGNSYDPTTPKFINGVVMILNVRNLDNFETSCMLYPPEQSYYLALGLCAKQMQP